MARILLVTGEASGDLHGATLARAIHGLQPETRLLGVGGAKMTEAGVTLIPGIHPVDAIGMPGLTHLMAGLRNLIHIRHLLRRERFDVIVFIDSPGMNLRLARTAAKMGQRVVYYIAPQIWAWGASRMNLIRRVVHRIIVIFPFEEGLFRQAGIPCNFVGHPLLDSLDPSYRQPSVRAHFGISQHSPVLGLLPGSRECEVRRMLPTMLKTAQRVLALYPLARCLIARAPSVSRQLVQALVEKGGTPVQIIDDQSNEVMAASDVLLVTSGTATLQAAVIGTPMVIVYRVSWLTYQIAKRLMRVQWIGLVNIIAGRLVVPELIQQHLTPERLSAEALRLLADSHAAEDMRKSFRTIRESLGGPGASQRAAQIVLEEAQQ